MRPSSRDAPRVRNDPLDRRPDGEGGGAQCEFGSTHLAHPWLATAPDAPVQAVDRTQPGLPLKKDRAGSMTHDYERHGTTTLFAAMNVLDATVIGRNMQRHPRLSCPHAGPSRCDCRGFR